VTPLDLVRLTPLLDRTSGSPDVTIGLVDGPLRMEHPELDGRHIRQLTGRGTGACTVTTAAACVHGTFVAGILSAKRGSSAPAICPGCTLLLRPIFAETDAANGGIPTAAPEELAQAIRDCLKANARVVNVSAAVTQFRVKHEQSLTEALDEASKRGAIVVAAAGNQNTLGGTAITRHPSVIPVVAYDRRGRPMEQSTLGGSIGRRGLGAAGDRVTSLGAAGTPLTVSGTSAAAPFVTGAIALLWSVFPTATASTLKFALASRRRRTSVVPPLLDAWAAHQVMRRSGHG
jgi:subtilisin family serine protease